MIGIRYLRPEKKRGQEEALSLDSAMDVLLFFCGGREGVSKWEEFLCYESELKKGGYIHFVGRIWEFLMWDDTRVTPIETAAKDPIKWAVKQ